MALGWNTLGSKLNPKAFMTQLIFVQMYCLEKLQHQQKQKFSKKLRKKQITWELPCTTMGLSEIHLIVQPFLNIPVRVQCLLLPGWLDSLITMEIVKTVSLML